MAGDLLKPNSEDSSQTETMSEQDRDYYYPARIHENGDAAVFWDAQDYPIHGGVDHESVFHDIRKALQGRGCAKVSIYAYVENLSNELRQKYQEAEIIIHDVSKGKKAVWEMLLDIYMWAFRNSKKMWSMRKSKNSTLIVLSKHLTDDKMVDKLEGFYSRGFGVLLSKTEPHWELPSGIHTNFLTSLFAKRKRGEEGHEILVSQSPNTNHPSIVSNSPDETMFGDLPDADIYSGGYNTCVFLAIEDGSVLAKRSPCQVYWELRDALEKKGYYRRLLFRVHVFKKDTLPAALEFDYMGYGFIFSTDTLGAGFHKALLEILCMAITHSREHSTANMLILTNVENFGQGTRLPEVYKCLKEKLGILVIAPIDQLIKLD